MNLTKLKSTLLKTFTDLSRSYELAIRRLIKEGEDASTLKFNRSILTLGLDAVAQAKFYNVEFPENTSRIKRPSQLVLPQPCTAFLIEEETVIVAVQESDNLSISVVSLVGKDDWRISTTYYTYDIPQIIFKDGSIEIPFGALHAHVPNTEVISDEELGEFGINCLQMVIDSIAILTHTGQIKAILPKAVAVSTDRQRPSEHVRRAHYRKQITKEGCREVFVKAAIINKGFSRD